MNQHCQELKQNILKIKIKTPLVCSILYKTNYTYPKRIFTNLFLHMRKLPTTAQKRPYKQTYQNYHGNYHLTQITCLFLYLYIYHQYVMKGSNRRESLWSSHTSEYIAHTARTCYYLLRFHFNMLQTCAICSI